MQLKNGQVGAESDRSRSEKQQRDRPRRPSQKQHQQTICNQNISNSSSFSQQVATATHHNALLATLAATTTMPPTAEAVELSSSSLLTQSSENATTTTEIETTGRQPLQSQSTLANSLLSNLFVPQQSAQQPIERVPFEPAQEQLASTLCTQQQQSCQPTYQHLTNNCSADELERTLQLLKINSATVNLSAMGVRVWIRRSSLEILFRVSLFAPIVLLGVLGNLAIIYSMCKFKLFRTKPTNIFILNMAIADLLTSLICPGAALFNYTYQFYVLGSFICRLEGFVKLTYLLVSSYSLIVLSSDWLLSIVRPFKARITVRQSWLVLSGIWISAILLATPLFVWRNLRERQWKDLTEVWCGEQIAYTRHYWPIVCMVLFYLPTLFMTFVLLVILAQMDKFEAKLRRSACADNRPQHQASSSSLAINMKYKRRIVKILFFYLFTSIVCWTPFQFTVIHRYRRFGTVEVLPDWYNDVNFFAQLGASLAAAMNPIIFGFMSQPFRRIVSKLLQFKFLGKIMSTNGKNSAYELRAMDQTQRNNNKNNDHNQRQPPEVAGSAANSQKQPQASSLNHNQQTNQQQKNKQISKDKAQNNSSSKLQISTINLNLTATNQASNRQSVAAVGRTTSETSRQPFSAIRKSITGDASNTNNISNKRVSFNTSIPSGQPIRQPNAASNSVSAVKTFVRAIKQQATIKSSGRHANDQLNGQANAAFERADDRELALVASNLERRLPGAGSGSQPTIGQQRLLQLPSLIRKRPHTTQLDDCSTQRDQVPSPLSIVSMDSINIEENLEPSKPKTSDDDDDDGKDDDLTQSDQNTIRVANNERELG